MAMERSQSAPGQPWRAESERSPTRFFTPPPTRRLSAPESPPPSSKSSRSRVPTSEGLDMSSPAVRSFTSKFSSLQAYSYWSSSEDEGSWASSPSMSEASSFAAPIQWSPSKSPWLQPSDDVPTPSSPHVPSIARFSRQQYTPSNLSAPSPTSAWSPDSPELATPVSPSHPRRPSELKASRCPLFPAEDDMLIDEQVKHSLLGTLDAMQLDSPSIEQGEATPHVSAVALPDSFSPLTTTRFRQLSSNSVRGLF